MSIESKERASSLEPAIGPRLATYVTSLFTYAPNGVAPEGDDRWQGYAGPPIRPIPAVLTGAAVPYTGLAVLEGLLDHGQLDFAVGCAFDPIKGLVVVHLVGRTTATALFERLRVLGDHFAGHVEIQVHSLADLV